MDVPTTREPRAERRLRSRLGADPRRSRSTCTGERLEEDTLAEVEEFCVEFAERLDEELSPPER